MPGRKYLCGECRHHFGAPEGEGSNAHALMCPSCGSIDLTIARAEHAPRIVMHATEPAKVGDRWHQSGTGAS